MIMGNAYVSSSVLLLISLALIFAPQRSSADVAALFIFGDSTADVGTNTFLSGSQVLANFPYYGIDFPRAKPTGRFSNGFNSADYLAKLFGYRVSPQPFLYLVTQKTGLEEHLFGGVNFASAGAGILDVTGKTMGVVPLSEQIKQFATVCDNSTALIGKLSTAMFLNYSLVSISVGSNDIFGYFASNSTLPPAVYIEHLMVTYESQIKALYDLGARRFGIISVPPIGCCPSQRLYNSTGGCLEVMNTFAQAFHAALDTRLYNMASELDGMKYSLGNTFEMTINVINNPHLFKFKNVDTACCGSGRLNAEKSCSSKANLCLNRNQYLFWDQYHPTRKASKLAALTLYAGGPRFVTPINFSQLGAS